ncbi:MAG: sigma-54-dependent Fis family transcriptional regulator [Candidatus Latescibacteria bacterium]|nr:sigma-54-dependent Fis family transcriptional regulator [Candidatus Latescibacterota bacterium]
MDEVQVQGARVLVVDDVLANIDILCQALETAKYQVMVASSGREALDLASRFAPDLVLLDVTMPDLEGFAVCRRLKEEAHTGAIPVIFLTARAETADLAEGFRAGGVDYVTKPFHKEEVLLRIQTHLEKAALVRALGDKNAALETRTRQLEEEMARREALTQERNRLAGRLSLVDQREAQRWRRGALVGRSPTLKKILGDLDLLQSAPHTSVLILGESGTGKELIARAIHAGSERREGPFVPVNCAAIPRELADSLLFGHRKGAFTGAEQDQIGYFELAHGGTLFLDEVGTLPLELQPKLLRVLEERAVLPLGARTPREVQVRVLAATNADLEVQAQKGTFRQDLYYRLARFVVQVPPLRQRREDIGLLARHFLQLFAVEMGIEPPEISPRAQVLLEQYEFPGNVRELKNIVERALIESRGAEIRPEHLPLLAAAPKNGLTIATLPFNLEQAELLLIQRALQHCEGNITAAARLLGVERTKIYRRLGRLEQLSTLPPLSPG